MFVWNVLSHSSSVPRITTGNQSSLPGELASNLVGRRHELRLQVEVVLLTRLGLVLRGHLGRVLIDVGLRIGLLIGCHR